MDLRYIVLAFAVFVAQAVEAITGFGGMITAITLAAYVFDIEYIVPVLIPVNLVVSYYIVARHWRHVQRRELLTRLVPLACIGFPVGIALFYVVQGPWLKIVYGAFVVVLSCFEIYASLRVRASKAPAPRPISRLKGAALLISGGLMQGLYCTGGPLFVIYTSRKIPDKWQFRSTLSMLWVIVNTMILAGHSIGGAVNLDTMHTSLAVIPCMALGVAAGEYLHSRIDQQRFRLLVFCLLCFSGIYLVLSGL